MTQKNVRDDEFEAFVASLDHQVSHNQTSRRPDSVTNYEEVYWTGLELNVPKIIRAIGGVPNSNSEPGTAVTRRIAWVVGDTGKKFRVVFPDRDQAPDHLLWKIISTVNETTYVNRKKVFIHETKNPDIFLMVNKNGLPHGDPRAIYDTGWIGKTKFIMNCIDRAQMDWHRRHKHTMLLSKNVQTVNGRTFAEEGVPAFGFMNLLTTGIFKYYKDWRKYDLAITRLGLKETPFRIINATKYIEEIPTHLQPLVSNEPWLTEEEMSWQVYDLNKIFGYTSMTKIYNNLKLSIEKIDKRLGTRFTKLFQEAIEVEQEERAKNRENRAEETKHLPNDEIPQPNRVQVVVDKVYDDTNTATATNVPKRRLRTEETVYPKGWAALKDSEKARIKKMTFVAGTNMIETIEYDNPNNLELLACPDCMVVSPEDFGSCPNCGKVF